jgi:outer membrane protein OmpA-like peptidoglycan-associated protein
MISPRAAPTPSGREVPRRRRLALAPRLARAFGILGCLAFAGSARADDIALDRFEPAPAGDRFLGVPSPFVTGQLDPTAMLMIDYAHRPLLVRRVADHVETGALVAGQAVFHASIALAVRQRLLVHVDVPFLALQSTDLAGGPGLADFGDLRFGLRARLFGEDASPLQLALGGDFWAPTGTGAFVTDGTVRGRPYVVGGGLLGPFVWSALLGAEIRPTRDYAGSVPQGTSFVGALAAGYLLGERRSAQLGVEFTGAVSLVSPEARNTHAEALFEARYRLLDQFEITAGAGPGLTTGIGTPEFRAVLAFSYVPVARYAPPPPPMETVLLDRGPVTAAPVVPAAAQASSPAAQPSSPPADSAGAAAPAPGKISLSGDEIVSAETLLFAFGSAELPADSQRFIHALADFLVAHPEIRKVEIRGYADIDGTLQGNERLAQRRADAVRDALIHHSIEPARLSARGLGPRDPAAASTSAEGRQKNRRVEIWITQRAAP